MVSVAVLPAGCQSTPVTFPGSSTSKAAAMMSPAEAKTKLLGLLDGTSSVITPPLKSRDGWPSATENDQPKGTANVALDRYVMTKISHDKIGALLGMVERRWKELGYTIESVNADAQMPAVFARTRLLGKSDRRLPGQRHHQCGRQLHPSHGPAGDRRPFRP